MTLLYSTLLGGSGYDSASALAIDSENNVSLTGGTTSFDFPLANAIQSVPADKDCTYLSSGCGEAFVTKISADGKNLVYSTFLGGADHDYGAGIAVDSAGNAYITGNTYSQNFPIVHAFQPSLEGFTVGNSAAFIAKINPQGRALVFSTYYNHAYATGIAVDAASNIYVALTGSPVKNTALNPCAGGATGSGPFLAAFRPDGSLTYSASFGGTGPDNIGGIALDKSGHLYIAGNTGSGDFPATVGSYQPDLTGVNDGFVVKIDLGASPKPVLALAPACIVNAANYVNWADGLFLTGFVSPGEIITIFGNGLGPATAAGTVLDSQGRIAKSLAGVILTFDGIPAPLLYVQANQINAIVPFEIAGKQSTVVALQYNGMVSKSAKMRVAKTVPGIFTTGGPGDQIAALNQDGTLNSPANPAEKGSVVVMWASGFGLLNQSYADGQIVRGSFGTLVNPPEFQVNGITAETRYLGQAPELVAGAIQINLVVPATTPSGANQVYPGGGLISVK